MDFQIYIEQPANGRMSMAGYMVDSLSREASVDTIAHSP